MNFVLGAGILVIARMVAMVQNIFWQTCIREIHRGYRCVSYSAVLLAPQMNVEDWPKRPVTSALFWLEPWKPCRTDPSFTSNTNINALHTKNMFQSGCDAACGCAWTHHQWCTCRPLGASGVTTSPTRTQAFHHLLSFSILSSCMWWKRHQSYSTSNLVECGHCAAMSF